MDKFFYKFSSGECDGSDDIINLLGAKGAHLAEMCRLGLPVPPGFTIANNFDCKNFALHFDALKENIHWLENKTRKSFGGENPLLLSVRSGAVVSMPGMMDTILNLGLNEFTTEKLSEISGNRRFALDSYRRFIMMFSSVVLGIDAHQFESELMGIKFQNRIICDSEMTEGMLEELISIYKKIVLQETSRPFAEDVHEQLFLSINAVFDSWNNKRAVAYRKAHNVSNSCGTAVTIQSMVFGNLNDRSATGIAFSRNPADGNNAIYGEYLLNAQGEDIVSGIRTPNPIISDESGLSANFPEIFVELKGYLKFLEKHYKDMQDVEFTIEDGKLYILQTRSAKRTASAAVKVAFEIAESGLIDKREAIMRISPESINTLFYDTLDLSKNIKVLAEGLPASPGAASGMVVFSSSEAENIGKDASVILVRDETSPDDISGMIAAKGILTAKGGITSHAAVVARGMGKPCITGASTIEINTKENYFKVLHEDNDSTIIKKGDIITIDGATGKVILGEAPKMRYQVGDEFYSLVEWARAIKKIDVKSNAENLADIANAIKFGADGIGLCRTEHMFLEKSRLRAIRKFILCECEETRKKILDEIYNFQKHDFIKIFESLDGLSISIRLLDPPLHEFLPKNDSDIKSIAQDLGFDLKKVQRNIVQLEEANPMLGNRGVRLGMLCPEIFNAQIDAISSAALSVSSSSKIKSEIKANVEIMLPLVSEVGEILPFIERIKLRFQECPKNVRYKVGTMIELPKAAITAGDFAKHVDFFSYGTNDLTQTTLGLSRDDTARLVRHYMDLGIYNSDPFITVDKDSVGYLLEIANNNGKSANPDLEVGVCGEHGGEHESILYFASIGCDYVSCSPFRVTSAIFSAAQSAIIELRSLREEEKVGLKAGSIS